MFVHSTQENKKANAVELCVVVDKYSSKTGSDIVGVIAVNDGSWIMRISFDVCPLH